MTDDLRTRFERIQNKINLAAKRAKRQPEEIKLIAVSKTQPVEVLQTAIETGISVFGENKVQEAENKIAQIGRKAEWHLVGHLQSNKARKAAKLFDVIHSIDSPELARRLERICQEEGRAHLPVLIQVDLAGEQAKSGVSENDLPDLVNFLKTCENIKLEGFMILPPFFDDAEKTRPYFQRLREIRDDFLPGGELSMGMSGDFEVAVEEGATIVRVGTAIFGERRY
jgi:PLP dependent protein